MHLPQQPPFMLLRMLLSFAPLPSALAKAVLIVWLQMMLSSIGLLAAAQSFFLCAGYLTMEQQGAGKKALQGRKADWSQ